MRALKDRAKELGLEYREQEGGKHTKVWIGDTQTVIPRHNEINEFTANGILNHMGVRR